MKLLKLYLLILFFWGNSFAQTVKGALTTLSNQTIKLEGFNGLNTYLIAASTTDEQGNFKLTYSKNDYGVGYLISSDNKPLFVILSGEDVEIKGDALSLPETLKTQKGQENKWFEQYAAEQPKREQALSAWVYLEKIYAIDPLFSSQQKPQQAIQQEKQRLSNEDTSFLNQLPKDSYVSWFLPVRKLVSSVSTVAQYRPEEIPQTIQAFRSLNYADSRLYKSGLFKEAIENHFWLLENSGKSLDEVASEMKISIDAMMEKLVTNEKIFNEVTDHLFDLLERHSLFEASEYLALKVLTDNSCTLENDLAKQLETYRAMKKGNTAADIEFDVATVKNTNGAKKLSDLNNEYNLVLFGASWCPKCKEEIPSISPLYQKWKQAGLEVVFISLDEDKKAYEEFAKDLPFISSCDLQKWNGKTVNDYYVFSTPTMFLLDKNRSIVLRPNSVKQVDAWVDWFVLKK